MFIATKFCSVEFTLDQYYDVTWHLPVGMEVIPLFRTTCFDVDGDELELMGSPDGRIFLLDVSAFGIYKYLHTSCFKSLYV